MVNYIDYNIIARNNDELRKQVKPFPAREAPGMDLSDGSYCMVCGDRSAGKHYGVMACYGCKGFFRRTIRSGQTYSCRYTQKCSIDKDQRNACRFCRFQRCLRMGMEPDAIRPDRDIIGKQKNPRKRKLKREGSLPSPRSDSPTSNEDMLVSFLAEIEQRAAAGHSAANTNLPVGIAQIKPDPDMDIGTLFLNKCLYSNELFEMSHCMGRVATVEQLVAAMRRYVFACINWVDGIFSLLNTSNIQEKVLLLRSVFASYCLFSQAARTSQECPDVDLLCVCNGSVLPRQPPRHLLETNLLSNNVVGRVLDELVAPMRKLQLEESEVVALTALIILDSETSGLSPQTSQEISSVRDRVQTALFNIIRERIQPEQPISSVTSRFGNILLLLPPLAKLSSLVGENVQFARMFGNHGVDPILVELFVDNPAEIMPSPCIKERTDVSTQTLCPSPILPSDLSDVLSGKTSEENSRSNHATKQTTPLSHAPLPVVDPPRSSPLVVPPQYNYFFPTQFPTLPHSASYIPTNIYQTPTTFYNNGSQSAPDPANTFNFM